MWHGKDVLELQPPRLEEAEGGRALGSYVRVDIGQYIDLVEQAQPPMISVFTESGDFDDGVHLSASEAAQVAQAMSDAARLRSSEPEPQDGSAGRQRPA